MGVKPNVLCACANAFCQFPVDQKSQWEEQKCLLVFCKGEERMCVNSRPRQLALLYIYVPKFCEGEIRKKMLCKTGTQGLKAVRCGGNTIPHPFIEDVESRCRAHWVQLHSRDI